MIEDILNFIERNIKAQEIALEEIRVYSEKPDLNPSSEMFLIQDKEFTNGYRLGLQAVKIFIEIHRIEGVENGWIHTQNS